MVRRVRHVKSGEQGVRRVRPLKRQEASISSPLSALDPSHSVSSLPAVLAGNWRLLAGKPAAAGVSSAVDL